LYKYYLKLIYCNGSKYVRNESINSISTTAATTAATTTATTAATTAATTTATRPINEKYITTIN